MHRSSKKHLEEYLSDSRGWGGRAGYESHLRDCGACRQEVDEVAVQARLLRLLGVEEDIAPAPGFYARVMSTVEACRRRSVIENFLDPAFGRRLAYACAVSLLVLSAFLALSVHQEDLDALNPASLLAGSPQSNVHVGDGGHTQLDRERVLVSLASYRE